MVEARLFFFFFNSFDNLGGVKLPSFSLFDQAPPLAPHLFWRQRQETMQRWVKKNVGIFSLIYISCIWLYCVQRTGHLIIYVTGFRTRYDGITNCFAFYCWVLLIGCNEHAKLSTVSSEFINAPNCLLKDATNTVEMSPTNTAHLQKVDLLKREKESTLSCCQHQSVEKTAFE